MKILLSAARFAVAPLVAVAASVLILRFPLDASRIDHQRWTLAAAGASLLYGAYRLHRLEINRQQRKLQQTCDLHLATVAVLSRAIDAKYEGIQAPLGRMEFHAARLAKAINLSEAEVQGVKTAALLHNIGKLAVPEHILTKSGPLTAEEFQKVQVHPQVGAEIIAGVPFPYAVAPLVLAHRERWDGKGYPRGLAGEEIPLGARILAVVDYFDALTAERPYRAAVSHEAAVSHLIKEAGRALDPELVQLFLRLLPDLAREFEAAPSPPIPVPAAFGSPLEQLAADGSSNPATMQRALENIALAHREVHALYDIAQSMGTSLGIDETMDLVSAKLMKIVPWSGCALFVQQPDHRLRCRFAAGIDGPLVIDTVLGKGDALAEWAAGDRRTLVNADPLITFKACVDHAITLKSAMVCPLFFTDTFIGCLALYHVEPDHYTGDHRRLVERVAEQVGAVIHNAVLFEQAQQESMTDPVTALPNRRALFAHLTRELARAGRLRKPLSVVMIDLDRFKSINDCCGHDAGDRALREVATALQGALRPYDLCVRYGGDEFVVVLGECSREMADVKRRELQQRISEIVIAGPGGERIQLRASAGAAVFPENGAINEALLAEADRQMYRDKQSRQGRAEIPGLLPVGELAPSPIANFAN